MTAIKLRTIAFYVHKVLFPAPTIQYSINFLCRQAFTHTHTHICTQSSLLKQPHTNTPVHRVQHTQNGSFLVVFANSLTWFDLHLDSWHLTEQDLKNSSLKYINVFSSCCCLALSTFLLWAKKIILFSNIFKWPVGSGQEFR